MDLCRKANPNIDYIIHRRAPYTASPSCDNIEQQRINRHVFSRPHSCTFSPRKPLSISEKHTHARTREGRREKKKKITTWIGFYYANGFKFNRFTATTYTFYSILFSSLSLSLALLAFLSVNTGEEITYAIQILLENNTP